MGSSDNSINIKELSLVREFFSHNIRTSTAIVVATAMIFKYNLLDEPDPDSDSDIISESAYFLDVYDKGMDICFDFVLNKPIRNDLEEVYPSKIIRHFQNKLPITIKDQGIDLEIELDEFVAKSNLHALKTLIEIILCQEVRNCKGVMKIKGEAGVYSIVCEEALSAYPEIYNIFQKLLAIFGVDFSFDNNSIVLRFDK